MRIRRWVLALVSVVAVLVIAVLWLFLQAEPIFSSEGRAVLITVHPGESLSQIGDELAAHHVISSSFAFHLDDIVQGSYVVRPGAYEVPQGSSFSHVRSILTGPGVPEVTASPGLTLHEVAVAVANQKGNAYGDAFVKDAVADITKSPFAQGSSLEGLIGDTTYLILSTTTPEKLAGEMVASFNKEAAAAGLTPATTLNGLDAYQLITAASIVEKEGYYPRYMPQVARVIYNRLARGGPLQMDSTVLYYLGQDGGTVTPAMLQINTPYNTYKHTGLTPTPICTVSSYALNAVLHAPAGSWLYFEVVNKDGKTVFSDTFAEQLHQEQVAAKNGLG